MLLLPGYGEPMVYYRQTTPILSVIREFLLVSTPEDQAACASDPTLALGFPRCKGAAGSSEVWPGVIIAAAEGCSGHGLIESCRNS